MTQYNSLGQEVPDPTPVSVPHGWQRPLSLHEEIKRFIRLELSRGAQAVELETFEEAEDFEVEEDPDPLSAYEIPEAPLEAIGGVPQVDADPPLDKPKEAAVSSPSAPEGASKA